MIKHTDIHVLKHKFPFHIVPLSSTGNVLFGDSTTPLDITSNININVDNTNSNVITSQNPL